MVKEDLKALILGREMKAVIFDLDGTLLDTLKDIALSVNHVLQSLGREEIPIDKYRYLVGEGALALMKNAMPDADESLHVKALELFEKHYALQFDKNTKMYEGISKMLTFFSARGYKMAVLSNKPDSFTKKCVLKYLRNWKFDAVFGVRQGVPKKPHPQGVYDILEILGVKPEKCLYVGDTSIDMITAKSANIPSIGVLWGFRDKEELLAHGAKYIVKTPNELIKLVATIEHIQKESF